MKIQEIIDHLEAQGTWVNFDRTRDTLLYGSSDKEVKGVGVCWVATNRVIEEAIKKGINFIISHENAFYENTTSVRKYILENNNHKKALLDQGEITVYRCHDVWDKMPLYGVADVWAKDIGLDFKRETKSYNSYIDQTMTVEELAKKVANALDGQDSVQVLGDLNKEVHRIAIGTGAATDIFEMYKNGGEVFVVSDDGINSWIEMQWCLDRSIPLIICNHAACEISGLKMMEKYLKNVYENLDVMYLEEGYKFHTISAK